MRPFLMALSALIFSLTPALVMAADATPPATATVAPIAGASAPANPTTETTPAPATSVFTDAQKVAIEDIVRQLLTQKDPDIVIRAAQEVQRKQEADTAAKNQEALSGSHDKIYNDPNSPVTGNPKGDVTIVEFFDYNCGYCKMTQPALDKLLSEDKQVKFIFKEFPILGPTSVQATKAALASIKQGKYLKFHDALMAKREHMSDDVIFGVAKDVGLNVEKLKKDMADASTDKIVQDNLALGNEIGAHGTPTFIIGDKVYPGALEYPALKQTVDDARKAAPKQ